MRIIDSFKLKRIFIISTIILLIISIIVIISLYFANEKVRNWIDLELLRKSVTDQDVDFISLNRGNNNQVHVYGSYIAILNDRIVTLYNSYGDKVDSIDIGINKGVFDSSGKYFVVAEDGGKEICLILDKTYLWSTNIEGKISQVHVNKNGYVAVIAEDTTYKSILIVYNSEGKKLFTRYFASTRIIDASISNDNKYVAIGELDTSGTTIQSNIKVASIENAQKNTKKDEDNTIVYEYNANPGKLIVNVEYQENSQITCMYTDSLEVIKNGENKTILTIDNENIVYMSNTLVNDAIYLEEKSTGIFEKTSDLHIINTDNSKEKIYVLEDNAKELYASDNIIVINVGTDLYFVNTSGWLIKKYTANQEITNIKFSNSLVAVIYKDKIEIINL